jgi:hypothetical protein
MSKPKVKVSTPSPVDADKRIVEIRSIRDLVDQKVLLIQGELTVGHGFLVKVRSEGGEWIRDVLFLINRENTAICRNWPQADPKGGLVLTPKHKEPVEVEIAANSSESATFAVIR